MRSVLSVTAALMLTASLSAAAGQTPLMVHVGAGGQSCGQWIATQKKPGSDNNDLLKHSMMLSWIQGYLIGGGQAMTVLVTASKELTLAEAQAKFHTVSGLVLDPPDAEAVIAWTDKYCREHPLQVMRDAASDLFGEVLARK